MEGFIVLDYAPEFAAIMKQLAQWVIAGKIQAKTTVVKGGLQVADRALVDLFKGANTGQSCHTSINLYHLEISTIF